MRDTLVIPLGRIAAHVGGQVEGDPDVLISGPSTLEEAQAGHIVFVDRPELLSVGEGSNASALIVSPASRTQSKPIVVTEDPKLAFSKVLELFAPRPRVYPGVHPTAVLGDNVTLGENVSVGANAVVGDNAIIKDGAIVHPLAYIGHEVTIGEGTEICPQAYIGDRVTIGKRTLVLAGAVIGCDGFGFLQTPQGHKKIPQIGTVIIGDDVEIGACTTIDRATISATRIGDGTKIDDQVHVAHNCVVGRNCLLCGQVGIAGSTTLGDNVVMGGQVGVNDHVKIASNTVIAAQSGVMGDIQEPGVYFGSPARPHQKQLRVMALTHRLPELLKQIKDMEARIEELERRLGGDG